MKARIDLAYNSESVLAQLARLILICSPQDSPHSPLWWAAAHVQTHCKGAQQARGGQIKVKAKQAANQTDLLVLESVQNRVGRFSRLKANFETKPHASAEKLAAQKLGCPPPDALSFPCLLPTRAARKVASKQLTILYVASSTSSD